MATLALTGMLRLLARLSVLRRLREPETVRRLSAAAGAGPLSEATCRQLIAAGDHLQGHDLCRQLYMAQLDLKLHLGQFLPFQLHSKDAHTMSFVQVRERHTAAGQQMYRQPGTAQCTQQRYKQAGTAQW
ncbi:hypothetical protein FJT64_024764 [Amphibalanus amphitrite]|uniref:Uncharacterized protein n=1 Tax=Amphibalanus amphitrite TaxID=1232801 RepID=A0A6A4WHY7_AMPAM|nr:hypothetical protein FJT64_024764 [Amphibalanus amphitrite]